MRCGGITELRKIGALADAFGVALTTHLAHELSVGLLAATPAGYLVEYMELIPAELFEDPFTVVDGAIAAPERPGHGAGWSRAAVARYRTDR
jgi:L-alanine-DL-glutamate epimerase-like enolase superfamily enzyme